VRARMYPSQVLEEAAVLSVSTGYDQLALIRAAAKYARKDDPHAVYVVLKRAEKFVSQNGRLPQWFEECMEEARNGV